MEKKEEFYWTEERLAPLLSYIEKGGTSVFSRPRFVERKESDVLETGKILDFILATAELSFSQTLLRMIDDRGLTDVMVYKAAIVDRRVFSKLRSNDDYQPSRNTAIRLCIALRLSTLEALHLLQKAGFALTKSKKEDLVILYCLEHEIHDVATVDDALTTLGLKGILD